MSTLAPHKTERHSSSTPTAHGISLSMVGHLSWAVDDFLEKNAMVQLFCLIAAPNCGSDASVQTSQGTSGSGKASNTCSGMSRLMVLKALIEAQVASSLPLAWPERAVSNAMTSARPFQKE